MGLKAIILAAGKGTRMKSDHIKVVHELAGKPILQYVIDTVRDLNAESIYVVVGHQSEQVINNFASPDITFVHQYEQKGTGHAVMQVTPEMPITEGDTVIVLAGDCPLIKSDTLSALANLHQEKQAEGTILSVSMDNPASYGRILRDDQGNVLGIREAKDCTPEQYLVQEINTGVYLFNGPSLLKHLDALTTDNAQGEYYLTDILELQRQAGGTIAAFCDPDDSQAIGVNTRHDLAAIHDVYYQRQAQHWMTEGVTLMNPKTTYIDAEASIGRDTVIEPNVIIRGNAIIGESCHIGAFSTITDCTVDVGTVLAPYSHLAD